MGLNAVLGTALSALNNSQRAISVTANNIANAGTAGYTRQLHNQSAQIVAGNGAGVISGEASRMVDQFLSTELRTQTSRSARSETLNGYLGRVQSEVLGSPSNPESSLAGLVSGLAESVETLAATPESLPLRAMVLGDAQQLADGVNAAQGSVQRLRGEVDQRIDSLVTTVNAQLKQLYEVNKQIARDGATAGLADQRDNLVSQIAEQVDITVYNMEGGQVGIYARGGQPLLEGTPRQLVYNPASNVSDQTIFGSIDIYAAKDIDAQTGEPVAGAVGRTLVTGGLRASPTPAELAAAADPASLAIRSPLTSGSLQGLLEMRDTVLPGLADELGELADLTSFALNAAHNEAVPVPASTSYAGSTSDTGGYDAATRSGTAYVALVDRTTGAVTQTIALDMTQDRDTMIAGLNTALGAQGTAALDADGRLSITSANANTGIALANGTASITTTDAEGHTRDYGFAHYFGLNNLYSQQSGRLDVRTDLAGDPSRLGTAKLDVTTGPPLTATLGGTGDARGIAGVADAFQAKNATIARGNLPAGVASLGTYAANIITTTAAQATQASSRASGDQALLEDLTSRNAAVSGVNVDEELSMLVMYQQGYTVAARLISITNEMYDQLFAIGR